MILSEIREQLQDIRSYVIRDENKIAMDRIDTLLAAIEAEEVA